MLTMPQPDTELAPEVTALLDSETPLADFLATYRDGLEQAVTQSYPPRISEVGVLPELKRAPLGNQANAISALALSLEEYRGTQLVAEMGCGKTFLSLAAAKAVGMKRVLVMCPPHLVHKWAREVHSTIEGAETRIITSISEIEALRDTPPGKMLVVMLSREKAKLGHGWTPAYNLKRRLVRDPNGKAQRYTVPTCPSCGEVLKDDEGILDVAKLEKKRLFHDSCGEALWQADNQGVRRFPLAHYIQRYMKGFFELLVIDEFHEMKAKGSAQGIAGAALAESCGRILSLTGTLFGGYASNLFYLLYRFSPRIRDDYAHDDDTRFVSHYGVVERITRERYDEDGRMSRRQKRSTTTKERPGMSPALLPHLLFNTVFLRLPDVAAALPPYHEEVEVLRMNEAQNAVHQAFKQELSDAVKKELAYGSKRLLGAYLQALLHHPDTPWRDEEVTTTDKTGATYTVADAPALDETVIYPKEARLIELVKQERKRGRRALIYVQGTNKRDITPRLTQLLEREGLRTKVLKSHTVSATKREAWVEKQVDAGLDALICHPRIVQTGLDLVQFPTIIFYQVEYSVYTLRQASRRSWRIGQERPVKVIHLAYEDTLQRQALGLIAKKAQASLALEGEFVEGGLVDMAGEDLMTSLAKSLLAGDKDEITKLTSAFSDADGMIGEDGLPDIKGLPDDDGHEDAPQPELDNPFAPPSDHVVARVHFLDEALILGSGRKKQTVHAGTGILFPDLITG